MSVFHNDDAFAAMLLTLRLPGEDARTLNPREFHELRRAAKGGLGALMGKDVSALTRALGIDEARAYRVTTLLMRLVPLSIALEGYDAQGVSLLVEGERAYPARLTAYLGDDAPPVLFAFGNLSLLRDVSIAATGVSAKARLYDEAMGLAKLCAPRGMSILTAGDETFGRDVERAACAAGARSVTFLAEPLFPHVYQSGVAESLAAGRALALGAGDPNAPFDPERSRARNRCLYALSAVQTVFCLERTNGPMWDAAVEALESPRCERLYVRPDARFEGNEALLARGATPFNGAEELPLCRFADLGNAEQTRLHI